MATFAIQVAQLLWPEALAVSIRLLLCAASSCERDSQWG